MKEVVIAGYLRSAQSRSRPRDPGRDWFHKVRADELLVKLLPELLKRTGLEGKDIDDFIVASAMGVNEQFSWGGRYIIFLANLPETIPAKFVDQQCGSSMAAIHIGYMEIATGSADIVLVGGMEHLTRVPIDGQMVEKGAISPNMRLFTDEAYKHWDMETTMNMGLTAEKLFKQTDFTKEDMDKWAVRTAGISSPLNAAATSMVLMSKEIARKKGIKPLATIRSIGFAGVDPTIMGVGPVPASKKALKVAGLVVKDIDYWEINEAFCVVALNCIKELGIDPDTVNVMGGGTAIGHPLGATGIRLVGTLSRILDIKGGRYGVANACVGGGQGVATVIEKEDYK
jgi:acetyl-CoA C-acetyltransferase